MFDKFTSRLELTGTLHLTTALRIGAGRALDPDVSDLPVVRDALGRPYIPGSSFKGVLRSHAERLLRAMAADPTVALKLACNPLSNDNARDKKGNAGPVFRRCIAPDELQILKQSKAADLDTQLIEQSCVACQVFGAQWLASSVQIRDLPVSEQFVYKGRYSSYEIRNGVAIDRDTETASAQALYNFEVVPAGVEFDFKVLIENAQPFQLGLFFLALRSFERGQQTLGGATSRGLGGVRLTWRGNFFVVSATEPSPADRLKTIFDYLEDPVKNGTDIAPGDGHVKEWVTALRTKLTAVIAEGAQSRA